MDRVLIVASTTGHIKLFHSPMITELKKSFCVDIIGRLNRMPELYDELYNIDINRSPFKLNNIRIYKQIKRIINENNYKFIHCNTPTASFLTRLSAIKSRKRGTKVLYTAHGFHFYKGAPLKNWLMYFPIEWLCSFFTDKLITINLEDYKFAKKHLHAAETVYIPGVGIDTEKFARNTVDVKSKKKELGIPENNTVILSVGELNTNKNHKTVIKAVAELHRTDITYIICGSGNNKSRLINLAEKLNIRNQLILAGHRTDVADIYKCCDIFVFPSKREGLPVSLMEAMASGLPCVASDIRGCNDLIIDGINGYLCDSSDYIGFSDKINKILNNNEIKTKFTTESIKSLADFRIENVLNKLLSLYDIK